MILVTAVSGSWTMGRCEPLKVCADPNNLPFSNQAGEGFENKIAEMLARDTGRDLQYTWWPERKSFVRKSLGDGKCDVILGIPFSMASVLTTRPYYRSSYVFVTRKDRNLEINSLLDERLAKMRIGMHIVDDDYAPPARVLGSRGLSANIVGYSLFGKGDEQNPPAKLIDAVTRGDVDVAIVWAPFAGYFAQRASAPLEITPVTPVMWMGVPFQFDISMAVRPEDRALRDDLDRVLAQECSAIHALLTDYGIPTVAEEGPKCGGLKQQPSASLH